MPIWQVFAGYLTRSPNSTPYPKLWSVLKASLRASVAVADPEGLSRGGANSWRAREREPIWVSGAVPPVGSRGKAPGQMVRGRSPPEADDILTFETPTFALFFTCFLSFLVFNCDI